MQKFSLRICVSFDKKTFDHLKTESIKREKQLASYIRELVEVGLKVEEMATQNEGKNDCQNNKFDFGTLRKLLKINLRCEVESLYLLRCLLDDSLPEKNKEYLLTAKQKADLYVEELLKEQV